MNEKKDESGGKEENAEKSLSKRIKKRALKHPRLTIIFTILLITMILLVPIWSTEQAKAARETWKSAALKGMATGAIVGSVVGPKGTLIGAAAGAISGIVIYYLTDSQSSGVDEDLLKEQYRDQLLNSTEDQVELAHTQAQNMDENQKMSLNYHVRKAESAAAELAKAGKPYDFDEVVRRSGVSKEMTAFTWATMGTHDEVFNAMTGVSNYFEGDYSGMDARYVIDSTDDFSTIKDDGNSHAYVRSGYHLPINGADDWITMDLSMPVLVRGITEYVRVYNTEDEMISEIHLDQMSDGDACSMLRLDGEPIEELDYNETVKNTQTVRIETSETPEPGLTGWAMDAEGNLPLDISFVEDTTPTEDDPTYRLKGAVRADVSDQSGDPVYYDVDGSTTYDLKSEANDGLTYRIRADSSDPATEEQISIYDMLKNGAQITNHISKQLSTINNYALAAYDHVDSGGDDIFVPPSVTVPDPWQMQRFNHTEISAMLYGYLDQINRTMDEPGDVTVDWSDIEMSHQSFSDLRVTGWLEDENGTAVVGNETQPSVMTPVISLEDTSLQLGENNLTQKGYVFELGPAASESDESISLASSGSSWTTDVTSWSYKYHDFWPDYTLNIENMTVEGETTDSSDLNVTSVEYILPKLDDAIEPIRIGDLASSFLDVVQEYWLPIAIGGIGIVIMMFSNDAQQQQLGLVLIVAAVFIYIIQYVIDVLPDFTLMLMGLVL